MRKFLLILGWLSVVGSIGDGALMLYAIWCTAITQSADLMISLDDFMRQYLAIIYWVKQVAFYVLPDNFVSWLFGLPALIYFPVRLVISSVIGWWALKKAAELALPQQAH